jgi:DNA polymerase III epsilon subunit-like protein
VPKTDILNDPEHRVAVLDIEASGFGPQSYPIEVGVAIITTAAKPVETWSSLIQPAKEWLSSGHWSPSSAQVHGISIGQLQRDGYPAPKVCAQLNALLKGATVVTDAPTFDQPWLDRLFAAAEAEQTFVVRHLDFVADSLLPDERRQYSHLLRRSKAPHRAEADAFRLAAMLLEARLGYPPQRRAAVP